MQVGARSGMVTMEAALMDLVAKGLVSPDDVKGRVPDADPRAAAQGGSR
jgi:Tfp pilus assembly pilus retraction ATPase PilT